MGKTNKLAASGVFEYQILGEAIKNSDIIEITIHWSNPRQREAQMFLSGAEVYIAEKRYGWVASVSHRMLQRFQTEFTTVKTESVL